MLHAASALACTALIKALDFWMDLGVDAFKTDFGERIPVDGYGMMEHFNMVRFRFFRRIGAFSIDRTDPRSVRASLDYAVGRLRGLEVDAKRSTARLELHT